MKTRILQIIPIVFSGVLLVWFLVVSWTGKPVLEEGALWGSTIISIGVMFVWFFIFAFCGLFLTFGIGTDVDSSTTAAIWIASVIASLLLALLISVS